MTENVFISSERLRNFNEIFRKDLTYNIKSHKNQGLILSLEDKFLEKQQGGSNRPPAFSGLKMKGCEMSKKTGV